MRLRLAFVLTVGLLGFANHASANRYLVALPNASAPASISFTAETVQIAPVTPGARVVLFAASLESSDGILVQSTGAKVFIDDDRDGIIVYRRSSGIPSRSLWIAVDMDTGQYGVGTPSDAPKTFLPFPASLLKRDVEGVLGLYDAEQLTAEMLVVRPGEGAWHLRALEGGNGDADRTHNGRLSLASAEAIPVPGTSGSSPRKLKNRDVIAVIDPGRLEGFVTEIGP